RIVVSLKAATAAVGQTKLCDCFSRTGLDVDIVCNLIAPRNDEIARKCAEKRRTIVHEDEVGGVRRSPSKANVTDRVCHRHYDIGYCVAANVATRIDKISSRRRRSLTDYDRAMNKTPGNGADGRIHNRVKIIKKHGSWYRSGESTRRINGEGECICRTYG